MNFGFAGGGGFILLFSSLCPGGGVSLVFDILGVGRKVVQLLKNFSIIKNAQSFILNFTQIHQKIGIFTFPFVIMESYST